MDNIPIIAKKRKRGAAHPENLIPPMKPGETRNPKGGSKKARFRRLFKEWVKNEDVEKVYKTLVDKATAGRDYQFLKEFLERVEGKVPQKTEIDGNLNITQEQAANEAYKERLNKIISESKIL